MIKKRFWLVIVVIVLCITIIGYSIIGFSSLDKDPDDPNMGMLTLTDLPEEYNDTGDSNMEILALTDFSEEYEDIGDSNIGILILTDLPEEYNGKFAIIPESSAHFFIFSFVRGFGQNTIKRDEMDNPYVIGVQISNGTVNIPMWVQEGNNHLKYAGNDTFGFYVKIYNIENVPLTFPAVDPNFIRNINYDDIIFSNGSAIISFHDRDMSRNEF
jgi:hypothetical protein